jgi:uncharacterized protein
LGSPARADFPPRPADEAFFHDLAGLIDEPDAEAIRSLQQSTFQQCGVPIVVVTIRWMRDYAPGNSIEGFTRQWFDTWGIGSQKKNDGILILVSKDDRKARIELGADWGRRFDGFSKHLMDRKMVPEFKKGDYGMGIRIAVENLAKIALDGPNTGPPEPEFVDRLLENPVMDFNRQNNPIGNRKGGSFIILLMTFLGVGCLIAGIFVPAYRKPLLITGGVLIALALFFWIFIGIIAIIGKVNHLRDGGSFFESGGGGGGGFGGGSSGGGGASGSW